MAEIRLELSPEVAQKLDTEVDLLGFEDRQAYLRWIIGNRGAIEQGTERDQLLTEYQSRVDELEAELESRQPVEHTGARTGASTESDREAATDGSGASTAASGATTSASESGPAAESDSPTEAATHASANDSSQGRERSDGREPSKAQGRETEGSNDATNGSAAGPSERNDLDGNFRPERVERFEDQSLGTQADQLRGVEGERLDEFARRAVAKTRERLGRDPSTGLDYQSRTRIARSSSDVRPGEDLVDLDALDVPGRSEEAMAPRREAVGAALAYLRDVGRAKRSDFLDELYEEYPAGYDTEDGWWRCVKRGMKDAHVVDGGGDGSRVWRYQPPGSKEGELVGGGPNRIVDPE